MPGPVASATHKIMWARGRGFVACKFWLIHLDPNFQKVNLKNKGTEVSSECSQNPSIPRASLFIVSSKSGKFLLSTFEVYAFHCTDRQKRQKEII